jgi:hypothetical protein
MDACFSRRDGERGYCVVRSCLRRLALVVALALAGCSGGGLNLDAIPPDSGWQPQGVNGANIRAMAADPNDVVRGRAAADALGPEAEPPVERLWSGHPKPLPASDIDTSTSEASQPPAAPAQGGSN